MTFKDIKYILYTTLGMGIISLLFWFRLFKQKLPRELHFYVENSFTLLLLCFIILFFALSIVKQVNLMLQPLKDKSVVSYLLTIFITSKFYINVMEVKNSPKILYDFLTYRTNIELLVAHFSEGFFFTYCIKKPYHRYFYIIFYILPKIIVLLCFIIDIFIFMRFNYFYKALMLRLIPVIIDSLCYIISNLAEKNIAFFAGHLIYEKTDDNNINLSLKKEQPDFKGALNINEINLPYLVNIIQIYGTILNQIKGFENFLEYYKSKEQLFFSIFYLIGWVYIFYINYHIFNSISILIVLFNTLQVLEDPFSGILLITF